MGNIEKNLLEETAAWVDEERAKTDRVKKPWDVWIDAELGLRNHWYPAALSRQIEEGGFKAITLLGENILLTRQDGKLFALEDRCPHRGVRFSARPLCYTKETLTCWYHTFTFNLEDGNLRTILNEPESPMIGKVQIKSYPLEELKGVVFAFVGDISPPPVGHDVAPGFLDDDAVVYCAEPYVIDANWRLACENGYDPGHQFIHNWSPFSIKNEIPMSFGWVSNKESVLRTTTYFDSDDGPKGFTRRAAETNIVQEAVIPMNDGSLVEVKLPAAEGKTREELNEIAEYAHSCEVGLWMPCMLKVDPWPADPAIHFESYVPRDSTSHTYFQFGVLKTNDKAEADEWMNSRAHEEWEIPTVEDFTIDDAFARKELQKFYSEEDGWKRERLYRPDIELTMWRKFVTKHARGVQTSDHAKGFFSRTDRE
ncbi:Rieske 2Fe-2S domain-containing protein [Myxococcota bacterium]|nr:Rieske 2Fe-2S domain-containing protein [Myxococcota bacterium]